MLRDDSAISASPILIVDDNASNRMLLEGILDAAGYTKVTSTEDGSQVSRLCRQNDVDLVLLDLHMPGTDGYEVLQLLRENGDPGLPVLVFTADTSTGARTKALNLGASDFLTKPGDVAEICLRVRNFLWTRHLYRQVRTESDRLEELVKERTRDLHEAQVEILGRLAMAAEYRDDDTGQHTKRVSNMAGAIATNLGLPAAEVSLIQFGALLHDVGKIGIPDSILLKPARLSSEEYEKMKEHTTIGARLLGQSKAKLLQIAESIAGSHHERWDGTGYPQGLAGDMIPIGGRIVAVADAFDAMTSPRVYKPGMPVNDAIAEILRGSGGQFDPRVVTSFLTVITAHPEGLIAA